MATLTLDIYLQYTVVVLSVKVSFYKKLLILSRYVMTSTFVTET